MRPLHRAVFSATGLAGALFAAVVASASAQERAPSVEGPRLTFDVASIKRSPEPVMSGSLRFLPGGRYEHIGTTIGALIQFAYPTTRGDIVGAPDWIFRERYDVMASAGRDATPDEIGVMMRSLLEDRLNVRAKVMTEEQPIWHLVVFRSDGRLGPDLKPFPFVCRQPGAPPCGLSASREAVRAAGGPVSRIAEFLRSSAGRPIVDRTGLTGNYEFKLVYRPGNVPPDPADERPDVFTALREQLGLTLVSARGPVSFILVDRIERPTAN